MAEMKYHESIVTENERKIIDILTGYFIEIETESIGRETRIIKDLGFDSLYVASAIFDLERAFNISIPDEDVEKLATVGAMIDYTEAALKKTPVQEV